MAWRCPPAPDPGRRPSVRRGRYVHAFGSRDPGAAPVWPAQADSAACRLAGVYRAPRTLGRTGASRRAPPGHRRAVSARHAHPSASLVELNASGCANRTNLPTARRVGRRRRAGLRQPRDAAPRDRRHRCCEIVRGEARRSEPAVGWQRPPVVRGAQLGDRGRSPPRGRRGYRNRGKGIARPEHAREPKQSRRAQPAHFWMWAIATARQVCWAADSEQAQSRVARARAVPRDRCDLDHPVVAWPGVAVISSLRSSQAVEREGLA
jgi:hypothetical protein